MILIAFRPLFKRSLCASLRTGCFKDELQREKRHCGLQSTARSCKAFTMQRCLTTITCPTIECFVVCTLEIEAILQAWKSQQSNGNNTHQYTTVHCKCPSTSLLLVCRCKALQLTFQPVLFRWNILHRGSVRSGPTASVSCSHWDNKRTKGTYFACERRILLCWMVLAFVLSKDVIMLAFVNGNRLCIQ